MAYFLLTETNSPYQLKNDFPNGNIILRDYQKSFKKETRWRDTKQFLRQEGLGEVYLSYSNSERIGTCADLRVSVAYTTGMIVENRR